MLRNPFLPLSFSGVIASLGTLVPFSMAVMACFAGNRIIFGRSCGFQGAVSADRRHSTKKIHSLPYVSNVGNRPKTGSISTLSEIFKFLKFSVAISRNVRYNIFIIWKIGDLRKMNVTLTIQEKLKDLHIARGMGLEELAAATGISKSSLGKYESEDYKDISPFNLVKLAQFYGVSTDYLLGLTEQKNHPNVEIHELHLSDDMLDILKNRVFNNRLLCEMVAHKDFSRLMTDIEIYVDRIASMSIQQLDDYMDTIREKVQAGQRPENQNPRKVDLYIRTLELAHIREDEYFAYTIHNDIDGIIRDIREAHKKDVTTADEGSPSMMDLLRENIDEVETLKGSQAEKQVRVFCKQLGIPYDKLTMDEFAGLLSALQKSPMMRLMSSQRGKSTIILTHGKEKRKK